MTLHAIWSAARMYGQAQQNHHKLRQAKFLVRAMLQYGHSVRWFRFLRTEPELAAALPVQPQWLHKLQRPYLCTGNSSAGKLRMLLQHHALFHQLLPPSLRRQLLFTRSVIVARFRGRSRALYEIGLSLTRTMDKEGELMLSLTASDTQEHLATLAFSFGLDAHDMRVTMLGCLQGPRGTAARDRFREVTKDLYGSLPKILMIRVICALSHQIGMHRLLAVCNDGHVHNARPGRYHRVHADYDALWKSMGGAVHDARFYALDCPLPERDPATISSSKRAQHLRRKTLIADIEVQIRAFLTQQDTEPRATPGPEIGHAGSVLQAAATCG